MIFIKEPASSPCKTQQQLSNPRVKLKMAKEVGLNMEKNRSRKRDWKSVTLNDDDIFNLKEEGLISFEELTDYQVEDYNSVKLAAPKRKKKKRKLRQNDDPAKKDRSHIEKRKSENSNSRKTAQTNKASVEGQSIVGAASLSLTTNEENLDGKLKSNENSDCQSVKDVDVSTNSIEFKCDMSDWQGFGVPDPILAAMSEKGFSKPTPIQVASLPVAIFHHQDIIGAAETGSGKTLAFALPILTNILEYKERKSMKSEMGCGVGAQEKALSALILTPTRELALQIFNNIKHLIKFIPIHCAAIVGGLSVQKQERLLRKSPDIIVGTPGRLLSKINDGELCLEQIKFLVIDEVDRMLEFGHFKEASEILRLLSLGKSKWQTFLFSATLTVPQYHKKWSGKAKKSSGQESIQELVDKAKVSSKAKIIDLTRENIAAEQIQQKRVICTDDEKDIYLFYVILSHPGRTLIFVNSINCTRKITNFLSILKKNPLQLHAGKQQRQRLKALDRFIANDNAIMVATDVAARGLDIPNVDTVVHYHLPKDPKLYIHRSGRTARANNVGCSIILEGPKDFKEYKKICALMKLSSDLPSLEVDVRLLPDMKKRVLLAKKIDQEEHQQKKKSSEENWLQKTAKSLDLEAEDSGEIDDAFTKKKKKKLLIGLKKELDRLLQTPLVPKGFSGSFITKSGALEVLKI